MKFYSNQLFHIYNQGNNQRQVFFDDDHYLFFIWKMRSFLQPFGQVISYCLMPNHFHIQFYLEHSTIDRALFRNNIDKVEQKRRKVKYKDQATPVNNKSRRSINASKEVGFNQAIGRLLSSYTRAINKQKGWTGSLFRTRCKAKDGWIDEFITLKKDDGKIDYRFTSDNNYGYQCMQYIHNNPVKAKLVTHTEDWPFSSARDYAGLRTGTLCNLELGRTLLNYM